MTKKRNHIPKTNWYKGTQKPVREGAFQRLYPDNGVMFCWFDKKVNKFGIGARSPEEAKDFIKHGYSDYQSFAWRGLSRDTAGVAQ